jgi:hypothetical protein
LEQLGGAGDGQMRCNLIECLVAAVDVAALSEPSQRGGIQPLSVEIEPILLDACLLGRLRIGPVQTVDIADAA